MISALIAAGFLFLAPGETGGTDPAKVAKGDAVKLLSDRGADAELVVTPKAPPRNLLDTWHRLGAKVVLEVPFDPDYSPEFFRRLCGFGAYARGVDGVVVDVAKIPSAHQAAVADAKADIAACCQLAELADKCRTEANPWTLKLEGRRAANQLFLLPAFDSERTAQNVQMKEKVPMHDCDLIRLEVLARVQRLQMLLGLPKVKVDTAAFKRAPTYYRGTRDAQPPFANDAATPVAIKGDGQVALDEVASFSTSAGGFGFSFKGTKALDKNEFPGGKIGLKLWIPAKSKGEWTPYATEIDLRMNPDEGPLAPRPGGWLYSNARRFPSEVETWPPSVRVKVHPLRTYSPDYQRLNPSFDFRRDEKAKTWTATVNVSWYALYGQWPAVVNRERTSWYAVVTREDGTVSRFKLNWPLGAEKNFTRYCSKFDWKAVTNDYLSQKDFLWWSWYSGIREKHFVPLVTPEPSLCQYDEASDEAFHKGFMDPLRADDENLVDYTYASTAKDREYRATAKIEKEPAAVQDRIFRKMDRLRLFAWSVMEARKDYLLARFDGKMPEAKKARPKDTSGRKGGPSLDNPLDEEVKLDDVEF